jgi:tripartite ATP-independent transporter DctP family solute receptor
MKRLTVLTAVLALVVCLAAPQMALARKTLKLATVTPAHHAYNDGAREFARLIKEGTGGEVIVKVYPGGQLGKGERELLEGMQVGTIDLAITSTGPISNFAPEMGVLDLPFLFVSPAHVDKVLDGPVGMALLNDMSRARLKGLAFMENGFRHFTNSAKPLAKPEDFEGLKFRTMENPVHLASVRQLGAQATPMSWGEVYTSLQTKVIDGQENPVAIIHANKMSEVQKHLTLTGHFYSPSPLTMNLSKFKSLKPEWQKLFQEAALKAAAFERKVIRDNEVKQIEELKKWGMDVRTVDKDVFIQAMKPVYDQFYGQNPSWREMVKKITAAK